MEQDSPGYLLEIYNRQGKMKRKYSFSIVLKPVVCCRICLIYDCREK